MVKNQLRARVKATRPILKWAKFFVWSDEILLASNVMNMFCDLSLSSLHFDAFQFYVIFLLDI